MIKDLFCNFWYLNMLLVITVSFFELFPPAPARRPSRGGTQTMDQLGQPLAHPRDRRTMQEDPQAPGRHPQNHPTRPLQRATGGVQQQDQGHHTHGLRLPPRRQPHRHDQTQMLRPTHPIAGPRPLNPRKQQKPHFFIASTCSSTDMDAV